ncbi:MAG: hypothetical protein IPL96_03685 [Holophagaceae bacterium]|nr:hypothetical protein [Holophagaceae bacterium]
MAPLPADSAKTTAWLQDWLGRAPEPGPGSGTAAGAFAWVEEGARWLLAKGHRQERVPGFAALLAADPALAARFAEAWRALPAERLLAEMGLPDHPTFLKEAFNRLLDRVVPRLDGRADLYALFERLDLGAGEAAWFAASGTAFEGLGPCFRPPAQAVHDAAQLLAHRAAALGLSRDLLDLHALPRDAASPFAALPAEARGCLQETSTVEALLRWEAARRTCLDGLEQARTALDTRGVSSDLAYRMDLLAATLRRLDTLIRLHHSGSSGASPGGAGADGGAFLLELLLGCQRQRSLRALSRSALKGLSRKIVEHTGSAGEHYMATDRAEWRAMLWGAAGGGALTAGTALVKVLLGGLDLAPGMLGLGFAFNYSASFIAMQFTHLTLASKQPAATAAALAAALEEEHGLDREVETIAAITRGQVAATFGNLAAAVPAAFLVDLAWRAVTGHSLLTPEKTAYTFHSLHPFASWTLPFAALTGVLLWLSSLVAGWTANWSAYRRLPEAVAASPAVRAFLGAAGAQRAGTLLHDHLSGVAGYLALGFLLGFMPQALAFLGLPLDVRHVTLSAASLAFAASQQAWTGTATTLAAWTPAAWAALGILGIGALNFSVSFGLSLRVALRARDMDALGRRDLLRALGAAFRSSPGRFFRQPGV